MVVRKCKLCKKRIPSSVRKENKFCCAEHLLRYHSKYGKLRESKIWIPSQEEIKEECRKIRKTWSYAEERQRMGLLSKWTAPEIGNPKIVKELAE